MRFDSTGIPSKDIFTRYKNSTRREGMGKGKQESKESQYKIHITYVERKSSSGPKATSLPTFYLPFSQERL
jgi:hypothetical protein